MHWFTRHLLLGIQLILLAGCVSFTTPASKCPPDTQQLENCPPPEAVTDADIADVHRARSWEARSQFDEDPIRYGAQGQAPVQDARVKYIGTDMTDALDSLAAKLWLIDNAQHSIDMIYYIWAQDHVGLALMGALCNAVERGVDVRLMIDAAGSFGMSSANRNALKSCEANAGFMRTADGEITVYKARMQVVIFNALSKITTSPNRRSHDKLLIADGMFPGRAAILTGGRNISYAYYDVLADGSPNPLTYRDAELLLRNPSDATAGILNVGSLSEIYYTLLYTYRGNKRTQVSAHRDPEKRFAGRRASFRTALDNINAVPRFAERMAAMPEYMQTGFHKAEVRLAHEFGNLVNRRVVRRAISNKELNLNSIAGILAGLDEGLGKRVRIVSPYPFLVRYEDKESGEVYDGALRMREWLEQDPERSLEIVTNSVISGNNAGAQSVVDMDTVPRLLMPEEMQEQWLNDPEATEYNPAFLQSAAWQAVANHPQIAVYETGRMDSDALDGDVAYPNTHAKFIVGEAGGFVGTSNFDYRSRLYNNEMGFFFINADLAAELNEDFDTLVATSYRWGSPEWLEMRARLRDGGSSRGKTTRNQRRNYKLLRNTGLKWWF